MIWQYNIVNVNTELIRTITPTHSVQLTAAWKIMTVKHNLIWQKATFFIYGLTFISIVINFYPRI